MIEYFPFVLTLSNHSEPFFRNLLGWRIMASLFHQDLHARRAHAQLRA